MTIEHDSRFTIRLCTAALAAAIISASAAAAQTTPTAPKQPATTAAQARPAEQAKPPATATTGAPKPTDQAKPAVTGSTGQKPADPKPAPAPAREVTPEAKALKEASSITDPDKQIEALNKVIADFPKTAAASSAEASIINTMTKRATTDLKALQEQARKFVDAASTPNERARRLGSVASGLTSTGALLDEAEQYAKKALDVLSNEKAWIDLEEEGCRRRAGRGGQAESDSQTASGDD